MDQRVPMSARGYEALKQELQRLKSVERPANIKDIEEAIAHGDLSENAEYHAAKEKQGFIEGRIQELNAKLPTFNVVEPADARSDNIAFGATVTFEDVDTEEISTYQIVGPDESDLKVNRISFQSPIARALIGKMPGDVVSIEIPRGKIEVEITSVEYR